MSTRIGLVATVIVHAGFAAGLATIDHDAPPPPPTEITLRQIPPKKAPPPPPPPPPEVQTQAPVAAPAPAPKKVAPRKPAPAPAPAAAPAPSAPAAPADYNLKLGNSTGNGPVVAAAPKTEQAPTEKPAVKQLAPTPATNECADPVVKPKPLHVVQPAFTQEAQGAGITGKVRVEITISATGEVTAARVIEGLGYGLDEAALEAAKQSTFSAATRCGEPVETTFTIGMRFQK